MRFPDLLSKVQGIQDDIATALLDLRTLHKELDSVKVELIRAFPNAGLYFRPISAVSRETLGQLEVVDGIPKDDPQAPLPGL